MGHTHGMWYATCGGTIISAHHVLCAAHCFADGYKEIEVLVGDFSNPHSKKTSISATVKYNSAFTDQANHYNDVALLKLSKGVSSSLALPLCTKSYSQYPIQSVEWDKPAAANSADTLATSTREYKSVWERSKATSNQAHAWVTPEVPRSLSAHVASRYVSTE